MVETTFGKKDEFVGVGIYPESKGGVIDLSDDAIRNIEGKLTPSSAPKPVFHSKLFEQLDPEERVESKVPSGEFGAQTARPTELSMDAPRSNVIDFPSRATNPKLDVSSPTISKSPERNTTDIQLEDMALQAFYDGRTDLTIKYFSEMKDRESAREQIKTVIGKLEASKDYDDALKLSNLLAEEPQDKGRKVNLKIVKDPELGVLNDGVNPKPFPDLSSNPNPSLPDIDAEYTVLDESVSKANVNPPEVPPTSETISPLVPNEPKNVEARESIEANLESLRVAREKYATAYTEWEYKKRNSTKLWEKTMFALGAVKPAPERLTLRTTELEEAREEYLKALEISGKKSLNTYRENYERGTEEKLLLQEAMQKSREARELSDAQNRKMADEMIPRTVGDKIKDSPAKALRFLNNKWLAQSTGKKSLLALTLVSGGAFFAAPVAGVTGLRVARGVLGAAVGKTVGAGFGKYFDNRNATNEELDLREYAGSINETNFAEVEAKRLEAFEKSLNTKRRQSAIKIGAMVAAGGASAMASGSYLGSLMGEAPVTPSLENTAKLDVFEAGSPAKVVTPEDLGVGELNADLISPDLEQEVHSLKVDILSHYHDTGVPDAIKKNILDVPTEKLLEQFHLLDTEHNASAGSVGGGHILFENGKVVYEQGGITRDLFDPNIEIGQKAYSNLDFGAKQGIELEPEPIPAKDIITGEPLVPAENIKVSQQGIDASLVESGKMGETVLEQSFEGGKISVIHGTPGDPNRISMVFDGKEFAVGSIKDGIPKITVLPELKGGWFTSTIYERAFDAMKSRINPDTLGIV